VTTLLQATGLALIPTLVWGYLFVSRNPESLRLVLATFVIGTLSVVPVLLFMGELGVELSLQETAAGTAGAGTSGREMAGMAAFFAILALIVFAVIQLFRYVSRRVSNTAARLAALAVIVVLLVMTSLTYDQLRGYFGRFAAQFVDAFQFMVVFSLVLFVLERFSQKSVRNLMAAGLAAAFVLVVFNVDARLASAPAAELSSISTMFSLPFLLDVVDQSPLTLKILSFLQIYLMFSIIAIVSLVVIALLHIIYLLHERTWIKFVHIASLVFFSTPFLARALLVMNPGLELPTTMTQAYAQLAPLYRANLVLLVGLSLWALYEYRREAGPEGRGLLAAFYEEPLNFLGVGVFLTAFIVVFHWFGLPIVAFSVIFLAFAEEYSKHLVVRFTDDDSIRSVDDAIEFSIIVGLAFAFAENALIYFPRFLANEDASLVVMRSILTVLMHGVASGIFGYFYGLAHFSSETVRSNHEARGPVARALHRVFLFSREGIYHEAKMFEGLVLAGTFHATFNLAARNDRIGVMLVLVGAGAAFLYYLLGVKSNRMRDGGISVRSRPAFSTRLRTR
jgi:hypothetical protein